MNSDTWKLIIGCLLVGGVFAYLWYQGQITRFANYVRATREELKKCTWPSFEELQGQTVLIFVAILLLGGFTFLVDIASSHILSAMFTIFS